MPARFPLENAPPGPRPLSGWRTIADLWSHRGLVGALVLSDLRFRYVGSSIGFFWTVVNPIIELVTYTFVFNVLIGIRFHPEGGTTQYALFLFCGMVAWLAVSDGLTRATTSVPDHGHLLRRVDFPAAVLPAHVVASAVVNQAVRVVILAVGVLLVGGGISVHFLLVPLFMAVQAVLVLGLGFLLATLGAYFRDAVHWINAVLLVWMFVTPIFYPPSVYPDRFAAVLQLNPLAHVVGIYQELILNHRLPHPNSIVAVVVFAILVFVVGSSVFTRHRDRFPDLV